MSENQFASGKCLCGKVNYTINAEPLKMAQCNCLDCQRSSGTGHFSLAFFPKDKVSIEGDTSSFTTKADDGPEITRHFCPECGSRLFATNNVNTSLMSIAVGCVDDHSWFKPQAIVYNKRKPAWDCMDASLPAFDEMPPAPK